MVELKIFGAGVVIAVCGLTGFFISANYTRRPIHLRSLQSALMFIETEIAYTSTPLPVAMDNASKCVSEPAKSFFMNVREGFKSYKFTAEEAWDYGLTKYQENCALLPTDLEILRSLGARLGRTGTEEQVKEIHLAREQLKQAEAAAEIDRVKNERLWRTMGFLIGVFLVLLLY
ncbi:MAG: stage III sporulation protein AB [Syntrophomonadaceae bacterium]|nr:stage III sporulation protein AB [Syntrophomonadaceae bacterium]